MSAAETKPATGFLRHVLDYGAVTVIYKVVALAMLPLYTSWLSEAEYGAIAITDIVLVFLAELFGRHLLAGMSRLYFLESDGRSRDAVISTTTLLVAGASCAVSALALVFHDELLPLLLGRGSSGVGPDRLSTLLTLALLTLPFRLTSQAGLSYLVIQKRSRSWAGIQLAKMVLELGLRIWLLGVLGWGAEGFFVSALVGEASTSLLLTGAVLRRVGVRVRRSVLVPLVRFAAPLIPVGVVQLGLHQLDRRLVEHLAPGDLGLSWAGIFGLGYLVAATPTGILLNALFTAWHPSLYTIEDPDERRRSLARGTTWSLLVLTGVCALTALAGRPIVELLAGREGFRAAWQVVPWVATGYVFWGLYSSIQLGFYSELRTRSLVLVNLTALAANVALNLLLIPRFGYVGAGAATLATFALLATAAWWLIRRAFPIPFETPRILATSALALAAGATGLWVDTACGDWGPASSIALRLALVAVFWSLLLGPFLRPEERARLRERMVVVSGRLRRGA